MKTKMRIKEYVFRKRDGSIRILKGSRDFGAFERERPNTWSVIKPNGLRKSSPSVITLIDVEINAWRSIKPETIISERIVGRFAPTFKFSSKDGWVRKSDKANFIKSDKVPYHILMTMNKKTPIKKNDVEVIVTHIMESEHRNLSYRNGHLRAFMRAFKLFLDNGFIEKLKNRKGDYYHMTSKGKEMLMSSVK